MCVEIQIENGPRLDCLGELWGLFGRENVVMADTAGAPADWKADECLCHVDVAATAKASGYISRSGWESHAVHYIWARQR